MLIKQKVCTRNASNITVILICSNGNVISNGNWYLADEIQDNITTNNQDMMNFKLYLSGVEHRSGASNGG